MRRRLKRVGVLAVLTATFLSAAGLASAELVERGNLFVKFKGGIDPTALPRQVNAPIAVRVDGTVRSLSKDEPPALRFISIAINRGGEIDTKGLPRCKRGEIETTSAAQALEICRSSLVGRGRFSAAVSFPEQVAFPLRGGILAFNAVVDGERAILAHVYGTDPFPNTRIIVFRIRKSAGTFGTVLSATLPSSLIGHGYLKRIILDLRREFVYRGRTRSYLSAACAAPAGVDIGVFPFVRVGMAFDDGRKLSSTLIRTCRVRR
jgi:hypothetical protein